MHYEKHHTESESLARGLLSPDECPEIATQFFASQWIFLGGALIPCLLAALLSQQDLDTLALRGESTLFVALFLKWLVTIYLWIPILVPTWLALRGHCSSHWPVVYFGAQLISGPFLAYLHVAICYGVLSRIAHRGPFALRHPWVYYRSTRYLTDLVLYYALVLCIHGVSYYRRNRSEGIRRLQLENELLLAQLQMLGIQLQPHFLFNALNSISSLMRRDVDAADDLLVEVSAFLRQTLAVSGRTTISLEEELVLATMYCNLQSRRRPFQASLRIDAVPHSLKAQVPPMILQPLIENAFLHSRTEMLHLELTIRSKEDNVHVCLENNGAFLSEAPLHNGRGVGLDNVRGRLRCLFGAASSLALRNRPEDGVRVDLVLPFTISMEAASHA
jgi:two-component system LytT family sensor kinase